MDTNSIIQLISSVGFPIVCCIVLFKMYNTTIEQFRETISENTKMTESLKTAISALILEMRGRDKP